MAVDNTIRSLTKLIADLKIPVTKNSISVELQRHPHFPSLLSISDVLDNWGVANAACSISFDELKDVPTPYIVNFSNGDFVEVSQLNDREAIVSHHKWNRHTLPINDFKRKYAGTVLIAEKDAESGERDYSKKHAREVLNSAGKALGILVPVLLLSYLAFLHPQYIKQFSIQTGLLSIIKTAGLAVSVLLLMQSIDSNNPLIQKLCGGGNSNNNDCNAILSSKAAKLTDSISWSEIGFIYFASTWLVLIFNIANHSLIQTLAILNLLSLPYTIYSIYYQYKIAKQWCVLCCTVQALLWLEFFAFIPYLNAIALPDAKGCITLIVSTLLPVFTWIFIKPYLLKLSQLKPLKILLNRFKHNADLFNGMLASRPKFTQPDEDWSLILGPSNAKNVVTMVSNPYCQPCAKMHKLLEAFLAERNDVQARIVFMTNVTTNDGITKVSRHLMAINNEYDKAKTKTALTDWYDQKQKNYDAWSKTHAVNITEGELYSLDKQKAWCDLLDIKATPTILVNGVKLPDLYQLPDLKYMLE